MKNLQLDIPFHISGIMNRELNLPIFLFATDCHGLALLTGLQPVFDKVAENTAQ